MPGEVNASFIVPSVFDPEVAPAVAAAVTEAARAGRAASGRPTPGERRD
jgi:malate dehydrogenase (oxaloacetate-decarboxylating)